jgi:hypothetical protein
VVVLFLAGQLTLTKFGFEHNLYQFAGTSAVPLSDMNGQGNFARHAAWFRAYWTAFAAILTVLAYALWRRGASSPLKGRLQAPAVTPPGAPGLAVAVFALLMAGLGGFIYYNTNVLNQYRSLQDSQRWQADYEKALLPAREGAAAQGHRCHAERRPLSRRAARRDEGHLRRREQDRAPDAEIHVSWARGHEQRSFLGTLLVGIS